MKKQIPAITFAILVHTTPLAAMQSEGNTWLPAELWKKIWDIVLTQAIQRVPQKLLRRTTPHNYRAFIKNLVKYKLICTQIPAYDHQLTIDDFISKSTPTQITRIIFEALKTENFARALELMRPGLTQIDNFFNSCYSIKVHKRYIVADPLMLAVHHNNVACVNELLELDAHPSSTNYGITPLHLAAIHGNQEILSSLIKAGASPNRRDCNGQFPAHYACNNATLRLLITRDNEDLQDAAGYTAGDVYRSKLPCVQCIVPLLLTPILANIFLALYLCVNHAL